MYLFQKKGIVMKAIQLVKYGEILNQIEVPHLQPTKDQLLVKVHAAGINPFDVKIISGAYEKIIPLQLPITPGGDFSGVIVQLGEGVTDFKVGDKIYGSANVLSGGSGTFAQELVAKSKTVARMPTSQGFEQSAAAVLVGVSSIQALEEHAKLQKGHKILIHGGAGGIGHIAVQLAKSIGALVIATVSADAVEFVTSLGADVVIDYMQQDFTEIVKNVDVVFDVMGGEIANKSFAVLKKGGTLVSMLGGFDQKLADNNGVRAVTQQTGINTQRLNRLSELLDKKVLKVQIDTSFPLEQINEALKYQTSSHPRGKVIIKMLG